MEKIYTSKNTKHFCLLIEKKSDPLSETKVYCKGSDGLKFSMTLSEFKKKFRRANEEEVKTLQTQGKFEIKHCHYCQEWYYNVKTKQWELPVYIGDRVIGVAVKQCPSCLKKYN